MFAQGAKNTQEIFLQANKEYQKQHVEKAQELYESIERKGPAVLYNLGNCCYHLKQYPRAISYWCRAQKSGMINDEHIEGNIAAAREQEGYRQESKPQWYRLLKKTVAPFPMVILQLLFLCAWYLLFWVLFLRRGPKSRYIIVMIMVLLCVLTWLSVAFFVVYNEQRYQKGIINQTTAVFAGPHDNYHVVGTINRTDEINILEQRVGWYKVMHDNTYGWVPTRAIITI